MKGVFQGYPRGQKIDDDEFNPFWKTFARLGIAHIFWVGFQPKAEYLDSLNRIEKVLKKHPDVIGIIGHLGGNIKQETDTDYTATPNELLGILRLPNAYFEVGYVLAYENWDIWKENYEYPYILHSQVIKRVYEEVGAERLMWGSDMPFTYRTCTYQQCLDLVRLHFNFMSTEEKELVMGGNAARIFLGH
jgi:predicted TIM-barrel fold metal-dependent hydrolase